MAYPSFQERDPSIEGGKKFYTVKKGDTLTRFAKRNNLTVDELFNLPENKALFEQGKFHMKDKDSIRIGKRIYLPGNWNDDGSEITDVVEEEIDIVEEEIDDPENIEGDTSNLKVDNINLRHDARMANINRRFDRRKNRWANRAARQKNRLERRSLRRQNRLESAVHGKAQRNPDMFDYNVQDGTVSVADPNNPSASRVYNMDELADAGGMKFLRQTKRDINQSTRQHDRRKKQFDREVGNIGSFGNWLNPSTDKFGNLKESTIRRNANQGSGDPFGGGGIDYQERRAANKAQRHSDQDARKRDKFGEAATWEGNWADLSRQEKKSIRGDYRTLKKMDKDIAKFNAQDREALQNFANEGGLDPISNYLGIDPSLNKEKNTSDPFMKTGGSPMRYTSIGATPYGHNPIQNVGQIVFDESAQENIQAANQNAKIQAEYASNLGNTMQDPFKFNDMLSQFGQATGGMSMTMGDIKKSFADLKAGNPFGGKGGNPLGGGSEFSEVPNWLHKQWSRNPGTNNPNVTMGKKGGPVKYVDIGADSGGGFQPFMAANLVGEMFQQFGDDDPTTLTGSEGFGAGLSGAASGASAGAIAGAPGMIVGGGIGALTAWYKAMEEARENKKIQNKQVGAIKGAISGIREAEAGAKQYWGSDMGKSLKVRLGGVPYNTRGFKR